MPKIRSVVTDADRPVLIEFQNGKILSGEEHALNVSLFAQKGCNRKLLGVSRGDMIYSGPVTADAGYNTFLVVQNDGSKKLKLIQMDACIVKPLLQPALTTTSPVKQQSLADLRRQFGSKKAKRYTEQQERLKVNIENVKEQLEDTVAGIELPEVPVLLDNGDSLYRPRINRDASTKEGVYRLEDLVPAAVLQSLEQRVGEILQSHDMAQFELISSVRDFMATMRSSNHPQRVVIDRCQILLYVHYLMKFLTTPVKSLTKKFVACECSSEVNEHLRQHYTINGARPLSMKDKGLCYTIVLLMLAMDYELNLEPVAKDLKIGLKKMLDFARNLGFSPAKQKSCIVLKIPVPPPLMPNLKRKRAK